MSEDSEINRARQNDIELTNRILSMLGESSQKESVKVNVTETELNVVVGNIFVRIIDTIIKKNADYGDAWQRWGIFTPLVRINDKIMRVQTLSSGQQALIAEEKIDDTLVDIIAYCLLALLWLKHNK